LHPEFFYSWGFICLTFNFLRKSAKLC